MRIEKKQTVTVSKRRKSDTVVSIDTLTQIMEASSRQSFAFENVTVTNTQWNKISSRGLKKRLAFG